jgi:hypothetical protein
VEVVAVHVDHQHLRLLRNARPVEKNVDVAGRDGGRYHGTTPGQRHGRSYRSALVGFQPNGAPPVLDQSPGAVFGSIRGAYLHCNPAGHTQAPQDFGQNPVLAVL